jgi:hypothetical protein
LSRGPAKIFRGAVAIALRDEISLHSYNVTM